MQIKHLNYTRDEIIKMFGLNNIPNDEILGQVYDFRMIPYIFGNKIHVDKHKNVVINESMRTIAPETIKAECEDVFKLKNWQILIKEVANKIKIVVLVSDNPYNKESIIKSMDNFGWFYVGEEQTEYLGAMWTVIEFNPVHQEDISNFVMQCNDILHWTPKYNLNDIFKNGLEPRSENKKGNHPERIYFMTDKFDLASYRDFGRDLYESNKDPRNDGKYALLAVNTDGLRGYEFYFDPYLNNAFFTDKQIPPHLIQLLQMYDFKNNKLINESLLN